METIGQRRTTLCVWVALHCCLPSIGGGLRAEEAGSAAGATRAYGAGELLPAGVAPEVDRAVERGVEFLLSVRQRDLRAGHTYWGKSSRSYESDVYPCAMTSLAGLAILARGSTLTRGPHADALGEITEFLLSSSQRNGLLTRGWEERPMYSHAFAMTFLGQVLGQEGGGARRERIRTALHRAIELTERAQSSAGGWGYAPNHHDDEGTLTVTQVQALRVCRDAGLSVSRGIIDRGVNYLRLSANPSGSIRYRPISPASSWRPGVTCAAVVALWNAGAHDSPLFRRTVDFVNSSGSRHFSLQWRELHHPEFVMYYLSQAKWVQGGAIWSDFYRDCSDFLVKRQRRDGSWEGKDGGDIYGTSIALLVLQLPYSRLSVHQR